MFERVSITELLAVAGTEPRRLLLILYSYKAATEQPGCVLHTCCTFTHLIASDLFLWG